MKVSRVREGLGHATNNEAEYRGLALGMKRAAELGFKSIEAHGDSQLVCKQVWFFHYTSIKKASSLGWLCSFSVFSL
jgi:ribonuclease HI